VVITLKKRAGQKVGPFKPDDVVTRTGNKVQIKSKVPVSDGCYSAGQATAGAPATQLQVQNAVLVTFPLKHRDGICTQAFTIVNFSITTEFQKMPKQL
jgi:hypothetical protein